MPGTRTATVPSRIASAIELRSLWTDSQRGILTQGKPAEATAALIKTMRLQSGPARLAGLLQALDHIRAARGKNTRHLSTKRFPPAYDHTGSKGIQKVLQRILNNFHENLPFAEILSTSGMSKATFERQFRKHTGKTFTEFLTEVRIDSACRRLAETDHSISEIAFSCGFNNLSHFNHRFAKLRGQSPGSFRQKRFIP